jgi:hypothetical protein
MSSMASYKNSFTFLSCCCTVISKKILKQLENKFVSWSFVENLLPPPHSPHALLPLEIILIVSLAAEHKQNVWQLSALMWIGQCGKYSETPLGLWIR